MTLAALSPPEAVRERTRQVLQGVAYGMSANVAHWDTVLFQAVAKVAEAEAAGRVPEFDEDEQEQLMVALHENGLTHDDFLARVDKHKQCLAAKERLSRKAELTAAANAADAALRAHEQETGQILRERRAKFQELQEAAFAAAGAVSSLVRDENFLIDHAKLPESLLRRERELSKRVQELVKKLETVEKKLSPKVQAEDWAPLANLPYGPATPGAAINYAEADIQRIKADPRQDQSQIAVLEKRIEFARPYLKAAEAEKTAIQKELAAVNAELASIAKLRFEV